jgi:PIN domain nuclease of toxin-antitoxin system
LTVLDAYALVALVADEAGADEVETLLRHGGCQIAPANLAEAVDVTQRVHGVPAHEVRGALEPLIPDTLAPLTAGLDEAWMAGDLRARHYDKKTRALSLADCLLLAHAVVQAVEIATSDPPLAEAARAEGVGVVALPDTSGVRP